MNWRIILAAVLIASAPAVAQATPCVNPPGDEGDQVYNITYHVMQYCNGSHWVAMGSIMGQGDGLGDHTAGQALNMGGFRIQNLAPPTADNHAVTRAYVTSAIAAIPAPTTPNLSAVLATGNAAGNRKITGLATPTVGTDAAHKTYVDGKFGTLTNSRWCRTDGTRVICDQVAPSGGTDNLGNHTATATLNMSNYKVSSLATPTVGTDATNKSYVDEKFGTLTNDKWCRTNGTQVICDQDEPTGGGGALACETVSASITNGSGLRTRTVDCPSGKTMTGGGALCNTATTLSGSIPASNGWTGQCQSSAGTVYAVCCSMGDGDGDGGGGGPTCGVGGVEQGGFCWYLSEEGDSCTAACASHGGYNEATRTYAGSNGTDANCESLLAALKPGEPFEGQHACSNRAVGCSVDKWDGQARRCTTSTTSGATSNDRQRVCACNS